MELLIMRWFCPFCWTELKDDVTKFCPKCKNDLTSFSNLSFEDKLLLSLKNPVSQNRRFVIECLGNLKSQKAVNILCKMLFEKRDLYELMEIAKALFKINTRLSIECLHKFINFTTNKILKHYISNLLNRGSKIKYENFK